MNEEMMRDLANAAIDRQKAQLDLTLQLVDGDEALTLSMLCLCGAIGHTAALLAHRARSKNGKIINQDDAVRAVLGKIAGVLVATEHESTD